jgi:nicotinate-nucleotide adenylyltransferase
VVAESGGVGEIRGRVAFFGGSFDPPHLGHLAVARAARQALRLDTVLFAPVGAQPLKPNGSTAPFPDRLAMTELAIAGEPGFEVSLIDAPNPGSKPNYTLDTLRTLRRDLPVGGALFCLMGADSFVSLSHWRGGAEIPFAAALIVASRPGQQLDDLAARLPRGLDLEPDPQPAMVAVPVSVSAISAAASRNPNAVEIAARLRPDPEPAQVELRSYRIRNPAGETAPFHLLPGLDIEISASEIRRQIRCCFDDPAATQNLLAAPVAEYIQRHNLYR